MFLGPVHKYSQIFKECSKNISMLVLWLTVLASSIPTLVLATSGTCDAGHYYNGITPCDTGVTVCPAGTWSAGNGVLTDNTPTSCTQCVAGKFLSTTGGIASTDCLSCPGGSYSLTIGATSSTVCVACGAGKYSLPASTVCTSCPVGKYANYVTRR